MNIEVDLKYCDRVCKVDDSPKTFSIGKGLPILCESTVKKEDYIYILHHGCVYFLNFNCEILYKSNNIIKREEYNVIYKYFDYYKIIFIDDKILDVNFNVLYDGYKLDLYYTDRNQNFIQLHKGKFISLFHINKRELIDIDNCTDICILFDNVEKLKTLHINSWYYAIVFIDSCLCLYNLITKKIISEQIYYDYNGIYDRITISEKYMIITDINYLHIYEMVDGIYKLKCKTELNVENTEFITFTLDFVYILNIIIFNIDIENVGNITRFYDLNGNIIHELINTNIPTISKDEITYFDYTNQCKIKIVDLLEESKRIRNLKMLSDEK